MEAVNQQQATNLINRLKEEYLKDPSQFDFWAAQLISGNSNKSVRQTIVQQVTGEVRPISQCGLWGTVDVLKYSFQQYSLFN
jgi:hypothetical protein